LHLFSGKPGKASSLSAELAVLGIRCTNVDIQLEGDDMDLLADETWVRWKEKVSSGYYIAVIMGPPCRTFSRARGHRPGPPVLRGILPPELYGLPNLGAADKLKVQLDNILAERCFELASIQVRLGLGFAIENQEMLDECPSIFRFDSALRLKELPGVKLAGFDQ
jgi:hypothetical protein